MLHTPAPFFFFVGKPASGKETQARLLAEKVGFPIFMSGGKFRELIASGTYLGNRIQEDYEKGNLLPAWIADYLLQDFVLKLDPESGAIFEGSGRDCNQVDTIEEVTGWLRRPYQVFNLAVSDDTVVARSLGRARDVIDTDEEKIRTRLAEYDRLTQPAVEKFRALGKLVDIDGEVSPEEIHATIYSHAQSCLG
jgi:adenylate kinase